MKQVTGVRVDVELWWAYRELCSREKLLPAQRIEDFLRLVVDADSVLSFLSVLWEVVKLRI